MLSSSRWPQPRTQLRVGAIIMAALLLWHFSAFQWNYSINSNDDTLLTPSKPPPPPPPATPVVADTEPACDALPGLQDIFLVLRTGANEALEKLPIHFNTTLKCVPEQAYGIWSDYEETIQGHHIKNALDEIPANIMASHPDFQYYQRLQEKGRESFSEEELFKWATAPNGASGRDTPGWKLDKWKFLPIIDKAYRQRPDAKWFIFMESDTYLSWPNVLKWLSKIDHNKPYYLGHEMQIGDVIFAHGGSGFFISNPAMKQLVDFRQTQPGVYEEFTGTHWAGDCVLGKALKDSGVELSWQYPNSNGDSPYELDYNSTWGQDKRQIWCYYATTFHHMLYHEVDELFRFEQRWSRNNRPNLLRLGDMFRDLIRPKIVPRLQDWDNMSADEAGTKGSFEECRETCRNDPGCVQFVYQEHDQTCRTSTTVKLGHPPQKDKIGPFVSGWIIERVNDFITELDAQCHDREPLWKMPE